MKCGVSSRGRRGYSLVEMSLAIMVIALGLVAVFGLFPPGLDAGRRIIGANQAAAFAEIVFGTVEKWLMMGGAENEHQPTNQVAAKNSWILLRNQAFEFTDEMCHDASQTERFTIRAGGPNTPQLAEWIPYRWSGPVGEYVEKHPVAVYTYTLDIGYVESPAFGRETGRKYVRLEVWPGNISNQVRQAITAGKEYPGSYVFYREFIPNY